MQCRTQSPQVVSNRHFDGLKGLPVKRQSHQRIGRHPAPGDSLRAPVTADVKPGGQNDQGCQIVPHDESRVADCCQEFAQQGNDRAEGYIDRKYFQGDNHAIPFVSQGKPDQITRD